MKSMKQNRKLKMCIKDKINTIKMKMNILLINNLETICEINNIRRVAKFKTNFSEWRSKSQYFFLKFS